MAAKVKHTVDIELTPATHPKIDSNELRWLGEEADGKREGDFVVVWKVTPSGKKLALEPIETADPAMIAADFVVRTNLEKAEQKKPGLSSEVRLSLEIGGERKVLSRMKGKVREYPDAIFLSQSAFLKFVIPYYARMRSTGNLDDMRRKYLLDETCMAVMHFLPSEDEWFGLAPAGEDAGFCAVTPDGLKLMEGR